MASERVPGGVIVVNERLRRVVAVLLELVLIWAGQSRTCGTIFWVSAWGLGGAGLEERKSGRVLAKAVRSAFGNVSC